MVVGLRVKLGRLACGAFPETYMIHLLRTFGLLIIHISSMLIVLDLLLLFLLEDKQMAKFGGVLGLTFYCRNMCR